MASIYRSNATPQAAALPRRQAPGTGEVIAGAIGAAAQGAGQIIAQNQAVNQQVEDIEYARNRALQDGDLARRQVEIETDLISEVAALRGQAKPGGAGHTDAVRKLVDERYAPLLGDIGDEDLRNRYALSIARTSANIVSREDQFEIGARVEKQVEDFSAYRDGKANLLNRLPDGANMAAALGELDERIAGLELPDDAKAKLRRETVERYGVSAVQGVIRDDPKRASEMLASGAFDTLLDPGAFQSLSASAEAADAREANAAIKAQNEAAAAFKENATLLIEQTNDGGDVDPGQLLTLAQQAEARGDKPLAYDLNKAAGTAKVNAGFRDAPPLQISAAIGAIKAGANWRSQPEQVQKVEALEKQLTANRARAANDPLSFVEGVAPLDFANPASVRNRMVQLRTAEKITGVRAQGPLTPDEVSPIMAQLRTGGAGDQYQVIRQLSAGGATFALGALRQAAKGAPELQQIATLTMLGRDQVGGATRAREALNGLQILKTKPGLINEANAKALINSEFGTAIKQISDADVLNGVRRTADALYVQRAAQSGRENFDPDAYTQAYQDALGASGETGGVRSYGGKHKVVVARGLTANDMATLIARADDATFAKAAQGRVPWYAGKALTAAQLKTLKPVFLGEAPGVAIYGFTNGTDIVQAKGGGSFVVNMYALRRGAN